MRRFLRRVTVLLLVSIFSLGLMNSALATKPGSIPGAVDGHKITICHATNSASNPYVVITIDVAAWNNGGEVGHSADHHVNSKTGDSDKLWNGVSCEEDGGPEDA